MVARCFLTTTTIARWGAAPGNIRAERRLAGVALVVDAKRRGPLRTTRRYRRSALAFSATTEQLSLVASLGQRADDARTPRFWMAAVMLVRGRGAAG